MKETITPETCRSCGLCCIPPSSQEVFCDVSEADVRKLDRRWANRNVVRISLFDRLCATISGASIPFAAILTKRVEPKRGPLEGGSLTPCAALRGTPGVSVSCAIYDRRPKTCRTAVKPGDRSCRKIRKLYLKKQAS